MVAVDPGDMRTAMHQAAYPGEDISDRPLPEVDAALLGLALRSGPARICGRRYRAQAENGSLRREALQTSSSSLAPMRGGDRRPKRAGSRATRSASW